MPELPEVENYRKYPEGTSLDQTITKIWIDDPKLAKPNSKTFTKELVRNRFCGTNRIGKYLFVKLEGGGVLIMHFGLTGNLSYYKDTEDKPRFARIVFQFETGFYLAFVCMRKFGWVRFEPDLQIYLSKARLGVDATKLKLETFIDKINGRKAPIKTLLLDQNIAAGVGNWIADEILYQARIHPETITSKLSNNELATIFNKLKSIIRIALKAEADFDKFPKYFLIHNREKGGICFYTKKTIKKIVVGGRGTYFSPSIQRIKR